MPKARFFPILLFLGILVVTEATIGILIYSSRPREISVTRGPVSTANARQYVDSDAVDRFVIAILRRYGIPGAAVAIVRHDRILHTAGYGYNSNGSPVTPDRPMPIASLSKSFTAAAVMRLVDAGTVRLDDPVHVYLPEFRLADARGERITIRHLLNHSSGLAARSLPQTTSAHHMSLSERVEWLRTATLVAEPGTQGNYVNDNYTLLSRIVEQVDSQPFATALRDHVFAPLEMEASRVFITTRDPLPGVTKGHALLYGVPVPRAMPVDLVAGAGGVVSSANDLARWLVVQNTGGRAALGEGIFSPESVAAMHTASVPGSNYAFGWRQESLEDGTPYLRHSGRIVTYAAHQALFPDTGYAYAFVTNGLHPVPVAQASLIAGLDAIVTGRPPGPGWPPLSRIIDQTLAILTILAITVGLVGVARSGEWARRLADRPLWKPGIRCLPYATTAALALLLPWLGQMVNRGASVPWSVWFDVWPPAPILVLTAGLAGAAIVVVRSIRIAALRLGQVKQRE